MVFLDWRDCMDLLIDEKERKVYRDNEINYTMLDWGKYTYSRVLSPFASIPTDWQLSSMDVMKGEKNVIHIEALYEAKNFFTAPTVPLRLLMSDGQYRRIVIFRDGRVDEDYVIEEVKENNPDTMLIQALSPKYERQGEGIYQREDGVTLEGTELIEQNLVSSFLLKGEELQGVIFQSNKNKSYN